VECRGPGTFEENGFIYASVAGISQIVNKLIYISPLGHGRSLI
jgi:exosome complex RNA-binding protein Rrp4